MSSVPSEIVGLGSSSMKLRVSPGFDPLKAQVGPDEYFVLSRIDGTQSIREILLATGLPVDRGIAIVTKLRSIGALLLPGETAAPTPMSVPARGTGPRPNSTTPVAPLTPPHGVPSPVAEQMGRAPTVRVTPHEMPAVLPPRTITPHLPVTGRTPMRPGTGERPTVPRTMTPHLPMDAKRPAPPSRPPADPPTQPRTQLGTHPAAGMRPPAPESVDPPTVRRASTAELHLMLPQPTAEEKSALAEPGDLDADERVRILVMARLVDERDPWALLGVPTGSDAKVLKRAYFTLSKEIHPDRHYGKQLGTFADRLSVVFEAVSRAYARLTSPAKDQRSGAYPMVQTEQPQTPGEYAGELFQRACGLEVGGDALGAMKLFAAAVRIDPQTRYLRRAATCALAAEQPKTALEYAKKAQAQAPNDPSSARLLALAFIAVGRYGDAEEVLVMAMALKSENDVLGAELRNDLAEVRRLLSSSSG
ncbi:MAG TPA: DnaJ domain-containing protein [Kofleriaceae bacterium]|nr:DnaJ domain-containing protein [Kofleriaceae bacterium]